jgi:hypothetical protein
MRFRPDYLLVAPHRVTGAAPILRRITAKPAKHSRRDCVSYEIVEPNVRDLDALFEEALISLGFDKGQS